MQLSTYNQNAYPLSGIFAVCNIDIDSYGVSLLHKFDYLCIDILDVSVSTV